MNILGLDVGFGFTKATNGKEFVIFKSIYGDSTDIQFQPDLGKSSASSKLHITISDKTYFVGNFAETQSSIKQFTLDQNKLLTKFLKILALSAASCCYDHDNEINIVSGLPVGFLRRDYKAFHDILVGKHKILLHQADGKTLTRVITVKNIQMMPQPIGSIFNKLMDDSGNIIAKNIISQKVGVVDIGFRTTDFALFDHLQYIERGSTTMDTGISKCFGVIANKLRQESGVDVELYRLYKSIDSGIIKIKGKEYNISNLKNKVYTHAAEAIASDINRVWSDDWDIDAIILTGGGSMELSKYLQPMIEGNVIPMENNIDARLNNVQGYLKFGQYKWGNKKPEARKTESRKAEPLKEVPPQPKDETETPEEEAKKNSKLGWLKR